MKIIRLALDRWFRNQGRRPPRRLSAWTSFLALERLEDRWVPITYTVTNTVDSGAGSLRQAILNVNGDTTPDTIDFNIGGGGVQTIAPNSSLPTITNSVTIDGTLQPGYAGTPLIVLNGANAGLAVDALDITAGNSTVQGLVVNGWQANGNTGGSGVALDGLGNNLIQLNYFGTDPTGTTAVNNGGNDVFIGNLSGNDNNNTVRDNVISGSLVSGLGIYQNSSGNVVQGNLIGTNAAGTAPLGNAFNGIIINTGVNNTIGGTTAAQRNVLSGNSQSGILMNGTGVTGNVVEGNYIGTNAAGTGPIPNGSAGIDLQAATNIHIGGGAAGAGNVISGNTTYGILVDIFSSTVFIQGNYVGTTADGLSALGNGNDGILLSEDSDHNVIGTDGDGVNDATEGNVIAGNAGEGNILLHGASNNTVAGNIIGLDKNGNNALPGASTNTFGVVIRYDISDSVGSMNNVIGTNGDGVSDDLERNIISGNTAGGVLIHGVGGQPGSGPTGNVIAGNYIGTDVTGLLARPNATVGVQISLGAQNNRVGTNVADVDAAAERNVISANAGNGITITDDSTTLNTVAGNYIGTNATGLVALGNGNIGVLVDTGASDNTIGGTAVGVGNLLSGNTSNGVELNGNNNFVLGNLIGTDATGTAKLGNLSGVDIGGSNNFIGGTAAGNANVIAGNNAYGIAVHDGSGNQILGNFIGTNAASATGLGNSGDGIFLFNNTASNIIGGTTAAARNVISGNAGNGVDISGSGVTGNVVEGDYIGTNVAGNAALANSAGVQITGGATANLIGTNGDGVNDVAEGNVISGNTSFGVIILGANSNKIAGNYIGTDAAGTGAIPNGDGVFLQSATGNIIGTDVSGAVSADDRNIISGNSDRGIVLDGANTAAGNWIGVDANGAALGNQYGIQVTGTGSQVGGVADPAERNVISGNTLAGIIIRNAGTTGAVVVGNYIGTDPTGTFARPNGVGIEIVQGASNNTIGGQTATARNVISGNTGDGIDINGSGTTGNLVEGDYIGTDASGTAALGNGFDGVGITAGSDNNTVGGATAAARNILSGNAHDGVAIFGAGVTGNQVENNYIGLNAAGTAAIANGNQGAEIYAGATGNVIGGISSLRNVISGNANQGVVLSDAGTNNNTVAGNYIGLNAAGTVAVPNGANGILIVNGAQSNVIGTNGDGVNDANEGNVISGNGSAGFFDGILIADTGSGLGTSSPHTAFNVVAGNLIGLNAAGTAAVPNSLHGIQIAAGATGNRIGTNGDGVSDAAERNVISGNTQSGVFIAGGGADANVVAGNYIGTDVTGNAAAPNGTFGVIVTSNSSGFPQGNRIGTDGVSIDDAAERNVISGNTLNGVFIGGTSTANTVVAGNYIGVGADGTTAVGNSSGTSPGIPQAGVVIRSASNNTIGGSAATAGNLIAYNTGSGVVLANLSATPTANVIQNNAIFANSADGIDIQQGIQTQIAGNFIGTNAASGAGLGNAADGVLIESGTANTVGGTTASARNVISGNTGDGVALQGSGTTGNVVEGDYIGLDATGTTALTNAAGGVFVFAPNNTIGGLTAGSRNVIAGNNFNNVWLDFAAASGNVVEGNYIGTNAAGTAAVGSTPVGVRVQGGANNTIGGTAAGAGNLISGATVVNVDIVLAGASDNVVQGNIIGLDATGTDALAATTMGVQIANGPTNNTIGGTTAVARNVISGNGTGVLLSFATVTGNVVEGNYIGTDVTGTLARGNTTAGVSLTNGANANTVGGTTAGAGNVISGNAGDGVLITDTGTSGNVLEGNYIGTNAAGTAALGNAQDGVDIDNGAANNTVGGAAAGAGNVISGSGRGGVTFGNAGSGNVVLGNLLGTDASGSVSLGNSYGVAVGFSTGETIGGTTAGARNVISGNSTGINVDVTFGLVIEGNWIGLNAAGTAAIPNLVAGIETDTVAENVVIGGTSPGAGNVISGNDNYGILDEAPTTSGYLIQGNLIGTNPSGTGALGSGAQTGVWVLVGGTTVGGTAAARNIISGNNIGIGISNATAVGDVVEGNYIGTDVTGAMALGNGRGVIIQQGASNNTIGGTAAGAGNVISGNTSDGVLIQNSGTTGNVVEGNYVGTNAAGTAAIANGGNGVTVNNAPGNTIGGAATGVQNVVASGGVVGSVFGVAIAGNGDLIVADPTNAQVLRVNVQTGAQTVISSGGHFIDPNGVALDNHGNIYVADPAISGGTPQIIRVDPTTGTQTVVSSGGSFVHPVDVAFAADGSLFVSDFAAFSGDGAIFQVNTTTGSQTLVSQGTSSASVPSEIAFDANDNLLVVYGPLVGGAGEVDRVNRTTGARTAISSGGLLVNPSGLAIAADGSLLVTNVSDASQTGPGNVVRVDPTNGNQTVAYSGGTLFDVIHPAIAPNGDVYVTNYADNTFNFPQVVRIAANAARNIISGNAVDGVVITGSAATGTVIEGNYIGTNAAGTAALGNQSGVVIDAGAASTTVGGPTATSGAGAGNVISGNSKFGIDLDATAGSGTTIQGNLIGLNAAGNGRLPNLSAGIRVDAGLSTAIGGTTGQARNVIAGNPTGIDLSTSGSDYGVVIEGNYIGTDITGDAAEGAGEIGVSVGSSPGTVVGGTAPGAGNVISGNNVGVFVTSLSHPVIGGLYNSEVQGNLIGLNPAGTAAVPNVTGILVTNADNLIGGTAAGAGNVVSGNSGDGIDITNGSATGNVVQGNLIGTDVTGKVGLGNGGDGVQINNAPGNTVGGAVAGVQNVVTSGGLLGNVYGVAIAANGDLILPDTFNAQVVRVNPLTGTQTVISSGGHLTTPDGVALAANGDIYVAEAGFSGGTAAIIRIDPTTGTQTVVSSGGLFAHPTDLAFAANGDLYVADDHAFGDDGAIFKVNTTTGVQTVLTQGTSPNASVPGQLAFDSQGRLLAVYGPLSGGTGEVDRVDLTTGTRTVVSSGGLINTPVGLTVDQDGSLLVANISAPFPLAGNIIRIDATTGTQTLAYSGGALFVPTETAVATNGDLYVTNFTAGPAFTPQVVRIAANAARNVISGNASAGVGITGAAATGTVVEGNFIGTDYLGAHALGNGSGVQILSGANNNTIGGTSAGARNLISGNTGTGSIYAAAPNTGDGVDMIGAGPGNVVEGDYIGTDYTGITAFDAGGNPLGNTAYGVLIYNASGETVGGVTSGAGNLISGNDESTPPVSGGGVGIDFASGNLVEGNYIGTDYTGTTAYDSGGRPLGNFTGVILTDGASGNTVGGTAAGARNIVSGNLSSGVTMFHGSGNLVEGNYIGTDATGTTSTDAFGRTLGNNFSGIAIVISNNNTVGGTTPAARNVISGNNGSLGDGVTINSGSTGNVVEGNYIGTNAAGTAALGNGTGVGIDQGELFVGATDNTIGGTAPGAGNLISGNGTGISLSDIGTSGNVVEGNYIGTDATGAAALPNLTGVVITNGATGNTVGGSAAGAGNVISGNNSDVVPAPGGVQFSGNPGDGVDIFNNGTTGNVVAGNLIGTNATGTAALGNTGNGVAISNGASRNRVGGPVTGDPTAFGNVIAYNAGVGVAVGTSPTDTATIDNTIRGNSVFANLRLGIDLGSDGPTANHAGVAAGPNGLQNFPGFVRVLDGTTTEAVGSLNSLAGQTYTIDFYASPAADPSGYGEGKRYLGFTTITTDASGNASFDFFLSAMTSGSDFLSATATDAAGDTSEFAQTLQADTLPAVTLNTPTSTPVGLTLPFAPVINDTDVGKTYNYAWAVTFNGNPVTLPNPAVVADNPVNEETFLFDPQQVGTYKVTLTVTDNRGGVVTLTSDAINVGGTTLAVTLTGDPIGTPAPVSAAVNQNVTLNSQVTDPLVTAASDKGVPPPPITFTYTWTVTKDGKPYALPPGTVDNAASLSFAPAGNGLYVATLTVTDGQGGSGASKTAFVASGGVPAAQIIVAPGTTVPEGTLVTLHTQVTDGTLSKQLTYHWTITPNNGQPVLTEQDTKGTYTFNPAQEGLYVVGLTVTDDQGHSGTGTPIVVTSTEATPKVTISNAPLTAPSGQAITLTGAASDADPNQPGSGSADGYTLTWSVFSPGGQATPSAGSGSSFLFTPVGAAPYVVTLTATDNDTGQKTTGSVVILGTQMTRPLTLTPPSNLQEGQSLTWTANVSAPGVTFTYAWQVTYPDGTTATFNTNANNALTLPAPAVPGQYDVTVTATGSDASTAGAAVPAAGTVVTVANVDPTVTVTVPPPPPPRTGYQEGDTISLGSTVTDPGTDLPFATYQWTVTGPDGFLAKGVQPGIRFVPTEFGTYTATLTVTDSDQGVGTGTATIMVTHLPPVPTLHYVSTGSDRSVTLQGLVNDPGADDVFTHSVTLNGVPYILPTTGGDTFSFRVPPVAVPTLVAVTVTDDDGGGPVTVISTILSVPANTIKTLAASDLLPGSTTIVVLAQGNNVVDASGLPSTVTAVLVAVGGHNTLKGGPGVNIFQGDSGSNVLDGGGGPNTFFGSANDTLNGGAGTNQFVPMPAATAGNTLDVTAGSGANTIDLSQQNGVSLDLTMTGTAQPFDAMGNKVLLGGTFQNVVGSAGPDTLTASGGSSIFGGGGNDLLMSANVNNVTLAAGSGLVTLQATGGSNVMLLGGVNANKLTAANIVNASLVGGSGSNDSLASSGGQNISLFGGSGDFASVSSVGDFNVSLFGGSGSNDSLAASGGALNVTLFGGSGSNDSLASGAGVQNVTLFGGSGSNDSLAASGTFNVSLFGGSGSNDSLAAGAGAANVTLFGGSGSNDSLASGAGVLNVTLFGGSGSNDSLAASGTTNVTLFGGSGSNDSLASSGGVNVSLFGGSGSNDSLAALGGSANVTLFGGSGSNDSLAAGAGALNVSLFGGSGSNDSLAATSGGNVTLFGGSGSNDSLAASGTANVTLFGGSGSNDSLAASGSLNVTLFGGSGSNDSLAATGGTANATLFGGSGSNDSLAAINGSNVSLFGGSGSNDSLAATGGAANVTLFGGSGSNDSLAASGTTNVSLFGGSGSNDSLAASGAANVTLFGGSGSNDSLAASNGTANVTLFGGSGSNDSLAASGGVNVSLFGGSGSNDSLAATGGTANATLFGGSGSNDSLAALAGSNNVTLFGGSGSNDSLAASGAGNVTLFGGSGGNDALTNTNGTNMVLIGGSGSNDSLASSGGLNVTLFGGSGSNDSLASSGGLNVTLFGGSGSNDSIASSGGQNVTLFGSSGNNDFLSGTNGTDLVVVGGSGSNDSLASSGGQNVTLFGGSGSNDSLAATNGANVTLFGGSGSNDSLAASGTANVTLIGGSGSNDSIASSGGANVSLFGGSGSNDTVSASGGHDVALIGGSGSNDSLATSGGLNVTLFGGSGSNDSLAATNGANVTLFGGSGSNDSLTASGTSNVTLFGGSGSNDSLASSGGQNVTVIGGSGGNDTLTAAGGTGVTLINGGNAPAYLVSNGGSNVNLFGGGGTDFLTANGGNNVGLFGEDGDNTYNVTGSAADPFSGFLDDLSTTGLGQSASDRQTAGTNTLAFPTAVNLNLNLGKTSFGAVNQAFTQSAAGNVSFYLVGQFSNVFGTPGNDFIVGGAIPTYIVGGTGNDTIVAGSGDTTIVAGAGNDSLVGGSGRDVYLFSGSQLGNDTITQTLANNRDTIDLSQLSGGPATLDLSKTTPQAVNANLTLTLTNANAADVIGSLLGNTLTGNARDNHFTLSGGNNVLAGGGGFDTYNFTGTSLGTNVINDGTAQSPSTDALNFHQLVAPVYFDLSQSTHSLAGGTLTDNPQAVVDVVGSSFGSTLIGNPAPGAPSVSLYGGGGIDSLVAGSGNDYLQAGLPQVVLLDFDTYTNLGVGNHVYTQAERDAIQQRMASVYAGFSSSSQYGSTGVVFTQSAATAQALARPTGGQYFTIFFNQPPEGGLADEINFRHLDLGGDASVDASLILGFPGEPAATSANFIAESAGLAEHELGHLFGLRHADSFGPIGSGEYEVFSDQTGQQISGVNPSLFVPALQEPAGVSPVPVIYSPDGGTTQIPAMAYAAETPLHVMASPQAVGTSRFDTLDDIFFGEREDVRLAFDDSGTTVLEQAAPHQSFATAQVLGALPGLAVPNTLLQGVNFGKTFAVTAIDVVGHIGIDPNTHQSEDDYYSFVGHQGDLMNFEVDSNVLSRISDPIDSVLKIYDAAGNLLAYNDDEFESRDSRIFDFTLPADGVYYAVVDTYTPDADHDTATGDYELFMYSFAAGTNLTSLGGGSTLVAGAGHDTLIGGTGNDVFTFVPNAAGTATIMGGNGGDLVDETPAPHEGVTIVPPTPPSTITVKAAASNTAPVFQPIGTETVNKGGLLHFPAVATEGPADRITYSLAPVPDSTYLYPSGAVIRATDGNFNWSAGDEGTYAVRIIATDTGGNTAFVDVTINVLDVGPAVNAVPPQTVNEGTPVSLHGSVANPVLTDTYTYTWSVMLGSQTVAAGTGADLTFTPGDEGAYTVSLTVLDTEDGLSSSVTTTVTANDVAPTANPVPNQTVNEGSAVTLTASYTDPGTVDTQTLTWHVVGSNGQAIPDGHGTTFTFTPNDNGTYTVTLTVADADGGPAGSTTTTVTALDVAPTATPTAGLTLTEGQTTTVALNNPFDPSTVDAASLHFGFTLDPSLLLLMSYANTGTSNSVPFVGNEEGAYTVYGVVFDKDGLSDTYSTVVTVKDAALSVTGGYTVTANEGAASGSQTVARFTDPGGAEQPGDYAATITWGDGASTAGVISYSNGVFTVTGSHTYAEEGNYPLGVTVTHDNLPPVTVGGTATVAEVQIVATGNKTVNAAEGADSGLQTVATFTDPAGAEALTSYSATIAWGDNRTSAGVITLSGGVFTVQGDHTYAEDGTWTVTVTLLHKTAAPLTVTDTALVSDPPVAATAQNVAAVEGSATGTVTVARFTDLGGPEAIGDYSATINWGDGTTTSAGAISGPDASGVFTVSGGHTYAEEGPFTITVTINHDSATPNAVVTSTANVSDPAVVGAGATVTGTEGKAFTGTVATFTDPGGTVEALGDYGATIDWGDGTATTVGTISVSGGTFTVTGGHTYAEEGPFPITVTLKHDTAPTTTVTGTATISDPAVAGAGVNVTGVEGTTFTNQTVATFTDPGGTVEALGDYGATIAWGDGTATTTGSISVSDGTFTVTGSHSYAEEGPFTITVTLKHDTAPTTTVTGTATIADLAVTGTGGFTLNGIEGAPIPAQTVATFTDPVGPEPLADYSATVNWGDGSSSAGTLSGPGAGGVFTVSGGHTYAEEGKFTVTITLHHDIAPDVTVTGTAMVADPAVAATGGFTFLASLGLPAASQTVATFTDPGGPEPTSDYGATIAWGDNTTSAGTITVANNGVFTVSGAGHTYLQAGNLTITVTLTHEGAPAALVTDTALVGTSVIVLDPTLSGALTLSGSSVINVSGVVYVDSNSSTALSASGSAKVTASGIQVVGGFSNSGSATLSPTPKTGVTVLSDPFASLPIPSAGTMSDLGSVNVSGNSRVTLNPGLYDAIKVSGNATVTLNAGVYVLKGGGLTVSGNASLTGTGVLIYNAGSNYPSAGGNFGGISLGGNGAISLTAAASGRYADVVIFQARDNNRALSLGGNSTLNLTGVLYAADALVTLSGNNTLKGGVIADRVTMSGNSSSALATEGGATSDNSAGELLAGDLSVYVDDSTGAFTPDELARVQDTVNALDALLVPFNVTVSEVSDPAAANVVIEIGTTSPVGGLAQGALGCFTPATGEITLIQGWDWYAGADPTQIGSGQFDFQTIVTHELGHALGLGHSPNTDSPMYESLPAGVTRRVMTTTDLNVGDSEGLPDALTAALPPVVQAPPAALRGTEGTTVSAAVSRLLAGETQFVSSRPPAGLPGAAVPGLALPGAVGVGAASRQAAAGQSTQEVPGLLAVPSFLQGPAQQGMILRVPEAIDRLFASSAGPFVAGPPRRQINHVFPDAYVPHSADGRATLRTAEWVGRFDETPESFSALPFRPARPGQDDVTFGETNDVSTFGFGATVRLTAVLLAGGGAAAYAHQLADEAGDDEIDKSRVDAVRTLRR